MGDDNGNSGKGCSDENDAVASGERLFSSPSSTD
jgi:hypothetical protein